jgi:phosphatidylserine decarboxylase
MYLACMFLACMFLLPFVRARLRAQRVEPADGKIVCGFKPRIFGTSLTASLQPKLAACES